MSGKTLSHPASHVVMSLMIQYHTTSVQILLKTRNPALVQCISSLCFSSPDPTQNAAAEYVLHHFPRVSNSWSTTEGSASVDVSPISDSCLLAIFLKMRRMILPERVLGTPACQLNHKSGTLTVPGLHPSVLPGKGS